MNQPCPLPAPCDSFPLPCNLPCEYVEGAWRRYPKDPQQILVAWRCPRHGLWYLLVMRLEMKGEQHV